MKKNRYERLTKLNGVLMKLLYVGSVIMAIFIVGGIVMFNSWVNKVTQPNHEPDVVVKAETDATATPVAETPVPVPTPVQRADGWNDYHLITGDDYFKYYNQEGFTPTNDYESLIRLAKRIKDDWKRSNTIPKIDVTDDDLVLMLQVTEAEVTGAFDPSIEGPVGASMTEGYTSKVFVVDCIINRFFDSRFPNTISEIINQKNAFAPIADGRYKSVPIQSITACAVRDGLDAQSKDLTNGALFFQSTSDYNRYGTLLFTDAVGHHYFTYD